MTLFSRLDTGLKRLIKFSIVGASGAVVNLVFVYITTLSLANTLPETPRDRTAYLVGILISIFTNFLLNNAWTWRDKSLQDPGGFFRRLGKFYLVSAAAALVQYVTTILVSTGMHTHPFFSQEIHQHYCIYHIAAPVIGITVALSINFLANHFWTFGTKNAHPPQ